MRIPRLYVDQPLVSGDIGRHGIAVLAQREGLQFETTIDSDCQPLWPTVAALLDAHLDLHCLRAPTRGGLASALVELAAQAGVDMLIDEAALPVAPPVAAACELLGLDPLHVACEGRLVAIVPAAQAQATLAVLRRAPGREQAAVIDGLVAAQASGGRVTLRGPYGIDRPLDLAAGELRRASAEAGRWGFTRGVGWMLGRRPAADSRLPDSMQPKHFFDRLKSAPKRSIMSRNPESV